MGWSAVGEMRCISRERRWTELFPLSARAGESAEGKQKQSEGCLTLEEAPEQRNWSRTLWIQLRLRSLRMSRSVSNAAS